MHARRRGLAVAALLAVLTVGCGRAGDTTSAVPAATTGPAVSSNATASPTPTSRSVTGFAYMPLFPFADGSQVRTWQDAYRAGGHQPWHLDPGQTAVAFAHGLLGFTAIDRVVSTPVVDGNEAWVSVGFTLPNGRPSTAAVVHVARWGTGPDAPWEVAGTRDSTLTLDTPRYGTAATSPLTVGGTVSGVDESLHVRVFAATAQVGDACCVPAGGERTRWSTTVAIAPAARGTLTVVVSTGGHVGEVERFAVTGVSAPR